VHLHSFGRQSHWSSVVTPSLPVQTLRGSLPTGFARPKAHRPVGPREAYPSDGTSNPSLHPVGMHGTPNPSDGTPLGVGVHCEAMQPRPTERAWACIALQCVHPVGLTGVRRFAERMQGPFNEMPNPSLHCKQCKERRTSVRHVRDVTPRWLCFERATFEPQSCFTKPN
jgi:hypothetical protein